ncbi:MAG: amidohydrolase [Pseudomonadales bacterium]
MKNHALIILTATLLFGCQPASEELSPNYPQADLVLRNGTVVSVDSRKSQYQGLAIKQGKVLALGSDEEIAQYVGANTQIIELGGRTAIPGLIEGHGHFLSLGRAQQILDLTQARGFSDIVNQVAVAADSAKPGQWIFGRGWHQDKWQPEDFSSVEGVPTNSPINRVAPDNPVYLVHASGHAAFANDAALRAAEISATTDDPAGGTIVRDAQGRATGLLRENAQKLVERSIAEYMALQTPAQRQQNLREQVELAGQLALAHGITSFHDAGTTFDEIDFLHDLEKANQLPIRLYVMVRSDSNDELAQRLGDYYMPFQDNDFLTVRSIKRQIDGALGAHGAWLLNPYEDLPDNSGLVLESVADIEASAEIALANGFQVNTHAIGTRANRETLDLYERIWQNSEQPGANLRWRIEHAQHIHPEDIPRFAELGVIAAIQGVHCTSDGPWISTRLGAPRTELTSYRWRDLLDAGVKINNGTDAPVEAIDPFASFAASVNRIMANGEAFYPKQAMTRFEALHSYTLGNAYSAFEEDVKGSLEVGKLADIAILSDNPLTATDEQLPNIQVDYTLIGGQIAFQRTAAN